MRLIVAQDGLEVWNGLRFFFLVPKLTVSAAVRLIPSPPALVERRKTKMSDRVWKSATMSRRSLILDDPSNRMNVCFLWVMYSSSRSIIRVIWE